MASWVYRCYDAEGRLAYVGATRNLEGRLRYHQRSTWWAKQVVRVVGKVYRTHLEATAAETRTIRTENPRFNVHGRWVTRYTWTEQDWRDYYLALTNLVPAQSHQRNAHIAAVRAHIEACYATEDAA